MPAKARNLFDGIASFRALHAAAMRVARGKRGKPGAAAFLANLEKEVLRLERELQDGSYRPGRYKEIQVFDPKHRVVSAAPFRDRVVHHAFCAVCEPVFERGFIFDSYANRTGKGTHRAITRYERFRDRFASVLRCDVWRYFPAIDHEILKTDLRRRLACAPTLALADRIVDRSNRGAGRRLLSRRRPVHAVPAPARPADRQPDQSVLRQPVPDALDHYCKEVLRAQGYVRYVDDIALFHDDPARLGEWRRRIDRYLAGRRLRLHPVKTHVAATREPTTFLGFVLLPGGYRRLPEGNVRRFRNRLRGLRDQWRHGTATSDEVDRRVRAWIAHAEHADSWRLRRAIFGGGWYDPVREGLAVPRSACAARGAPGTTNRGTCARRIATGTTPTTGGTTTVFELPVRSPVGAGGLTGPRGCTNERPGTVMVNHRSAPFLPRGSWGRGAALTRERRSHEADAG